MNFKITNPVFFDLKKLNLINKKDLILINKKTRDKKIRVFQDKKSQIIFLEKYIRNINYYKYEKGAPRDKHKSITKLIGGEILKINKINYLNKKNSSKLNVVGDDYRRYDQFKKMFKNKKICDFGCGYAGFLSLCRKLTKNLYGVEVNDFYLKYLYNKKKFINTSNDINNFKTKFDLVTLFHVLEHLPSQISILEKIRKNLKKKGKVIIEVPHANDFLLIKKNNQSYKNFIFWSEHLVLHTERSIKTFLKKAGFKKVDIIYFQRYGFTNHFHWFQNGLPGGHEINKKDFNIKFEKIYKNYLEEKKYSDTIIAIASN
jgi:2-polyprenyl-3-methyl-5-hydroxy-6-metoxy-1,4-benzoquinol methylase